MRTITELRKEVIKAALIADIENQIIAAEYTWNIFLLSAWKKRLFKVCSMRGIVLLVR